MYKSIQAFAGFLLLLFGFSCARPPDDPGPRLHALFDREWELRLEESPLLATGVGRHEYDRLLDSVAPEDQARRADIRRAILDELQTIDAAGLSDADRISHSIFEAQLRDGIAGFEFREHEVPINSDSGFHTAIARLPREMPFATVADYDNYIARLRAVPAYFDQQMANMRAGLERGMTLPAVVLQQYDVTIRTHVVEDPAESVFHVPLAAMPDTLHEAERARLLEQGRRAITEAVVPAYSAFLQFMEGEYIPGARGTIGASELPDGEAYYALQIRRYTTLELTADEIHRIGLEEVERIRAEMDTVIDEVEFDGDFAEFLVFLRTDTRFYAETPQELLMLASHLSKKMDGRLPALFKTLPRLPYGVEPVPEHLAPVYTAGRYVGAPEGSTSPGYYWVNTYDLPSRPLYALEALTLHEAVPGHHLQISLNNELGNLPEFRRYSYLSAFGEGWGLYAERLGLEAGFYTDPYSNFGRLTYEMWRACRLVVDTGIHAMGWTREQAMDYLAANTALSLHEVRTEIDRYIAWPGQALAYKIGERKILELRHHAQRELGPRFDIRDFHDAVLLNGSVPLPVLEQVIEDYIADARPS